MAASDEAPPRNVLWEIARIKRFPAVIEDTVVLAQTEDGITAIDFTLRTDPLLDGDPVAPIESEEPLSFLYAAEANVGRTAPAVLSKRADFPRDLAHLVPASDSLPAALCLARAGPQPIYDRSGVDGILRRVSQWLADAKCGSLSEDYWELVPTPPAKDSVFGYIDAKTLQYWAAANPEGGHKFFPALVKRGARNAVFINAHQPLIDTEDEADLVQARFQFENSDRDAEYHTAIPAIFCWPSKARIETIPRFNRWVDIESLKLGLRDTGLWEAADTASITMDPYFMSDPISGPKPDFSMGQKNGFLLVTGLWRPQPLDPTIVGLVNDDDEARSLELRAFYLERDREDPDRWSGATVVRYFYGMTGAISETYEAVSGEEPLPSPMLIGAGALGSAFVDYAVKSGTQRFHVIDHDMIMPHNLARHRASRRDIQGHKTRAIERLVEQKAEAVSVEKSSIDVLTMAREQFENQISESDIVIDATAEAQVRVRLSDRTLPSCPIARSEIFHLGRLGVTLLSNLGSAFSLNYLYHYLISLAVSNDQIRAWLRYEQTRNFEDDELLLGFGCSSMTTKIPAYKIDAHASASFAATRTFLQRELDALIALNSIDENGLSQGAQLITPDVPIVFESEEALGNWRVVVSQSAIDQMHAIREEKAPNETGGFLYGAINEAVMEVYVVFASPEPPGTTSSPTSLHLGRCGITGPERTFLRRTHHRLRPVGTWHSHPNGSPIASNVDWNTIAGFLDEDAARALPTLMIISGATEDAAYISEP